jgi:hypothetical protein
MDTLIYEGPSLIRGQRWMQRIITVDETGHPVRYRDSGPEWADREWTACKPGDTVEGLRPHPMSVLV